MSTMRRMIALIIIVAAVTTIGCAQDRTKAPGRMAEDRLPSEEYPQIAVLDGLDGWLCAGQIVENAGPPLAVTVPVRDLADKDLHVQYRFFFLDEKGVPLNSNPDWHYMQMPSRSQVFMDGNALDSTAQTWRLEVRPAR